MRERRAITFGRAVERALDRHRDLLLHLFGGAARIQRDDDHLRIGNIRIGFDLELLEGPQAGADQRQADQNRDEALLQREAQKLGDQSWPSAYAFNSITPSVTIGRHL